MNEKNGIFEIDLPKLALAYLRRWWLILFAAVIFAGGALAYTYYRITPLYRAGTTIYVNNLKEGVTVDSVSTSNLNASQQLVSTYINIVKSDRVIDKVVRALDNEYSAAQISGMLSAKQLGETEIFAIYITGPIPEETARIANVMAGIVPTEIGELIEGSSARVIDTAKIPTMRYSPSYRRNTMIGAIGGAVLAVAFITVLFLLDARIKDEEDIAALFEYPILGQIPEFISYSKSSPYGYGTDEKNPEDQTSEEVQQ